MPYQIQYQKDSNCVFLVHMGPLDIEEARLARNELCDVLAAHQCNGILIDETRAVKKLSVIDQHQFTIEYGSELPADVRIAVVVRRETLSDARFIENVAFNRGICLRVFSNKKEALNWLSRFPSKEP